MDHALFARDPGTLGGSALASWTPLTVLLVAFAAVVVTLWLLGAPADPAWGRLRVLSRVPRGLRRVTGVPGWAATAIGTSLFGLLVAGQGFYDDVSWHIALGRDNELFTAPHTAILLGLVFILGGAVLGTLVATLDRVDGTMELAGLRVPRSLLPLWALGIGAISGFPLDEVWHGEYGVDVTMWSPTHMLMILGATFTGLAVWLVLAESGVRPTDGRWGRGLHVVCAWLALQGLVAPQGEFTFGVPQFSHLFHPILVCIAGAFALAAMRVVLGRGWALGIVAVSFVLMGSGLGAAGNREDGPVDTRFGGTFIVSAIVVELVGLVLGTERRLRFALVSGLGVGTVGLAGEWAWNQGAYQRWTTNLLPDAAVLGAIGALGAGVLGVAFARAVTRDATPSTAVPRPVLALAAVACVVVVLVPMRRGSGDVEAVVRLDRVDDGHAYVEARVTPPDAAEDALWFQASAWQGGGLVLADMERTATPGSYRSSEPIPIDGLWKSLVRLHRRGEMMAVPVYLPDDPTIDEIGVPAVDERTATFANERRYLLRETVVGNGWLSPLVHAGLALVCALWALAFVVAVRGLTGGGRGGGGRRRPWFGSARPVPG